MPSIDTNILDSVNKPASYMGFETGARHKSPSEGGVHWVLAFPDSYEIGSTHLGFQVIYHVLNEHPASAADRVFSPWHDFSRELESHQKLLCSLEKKLPLRSFDVIGFSLAYELGYTNVLQILHLGGVPIRSADRGKGDPLIVAGGVCTCNPEPMSAFIDAFVVGDGEEAAIEVSEAVQKWKISGTNRDALLDELASIDGVYVPSRWSEGRTIRVRHVPDLDSAPFPVCQVVPTIQAIHDRAVVEIARGCPHSCRFCQAGFVYRPLRERSPEKVVALAKSVIQNTGYSDLTLLALSAGDYPGIMEVAERLISELRENRTAINLPSLRAGSLSQQVVEVIRSVRKTGFTIAPEAGSERLRRVINKGISDEEVIETARIIFSSGWNLLKLYFMFGLPTETQDDLEAIPKLVRRVRQVGIEAGIKPNINVGLSAFVPKPHTPFQWEPMLNGDEIRQRLNFLRQGLRIPGVKASWSDSRMSLLEGVMSRGDHTIGDVLERAWRLGAVFDGWGDHLKWEAWEQAFKETGFDFEQANKARDEHDSLPWDHIRIGASKKYLLRERERAFGELYSGGCGAIEECKENCGGCSADAGVKRAKVVKSKESSEITRIKPSSKEFKRYRVIYRKVDPASYLGHLDTVRAIHQSLRRANLRVRYSEGYHPMPKTRFGNPLPVGVSSLTEIFDLDLTEKLEPLEMMRKLNDTLPAGLEVVTISEISERRPAPQASIRSIRYMFEMAKDSESEALPKVEKLRDFLDSETFPMVLESKGNSRVVDLRQVVLDAQAQPNAAVEIEMTCDPNGVTPRPQLVWEAIFGPMPLHVKITKVKVTMDDEADGKFASDESHTRLENVELSKRNMELRMKNVE